MFRPQGTFPWLSTAAPFGALGSCPGPQTQMPSRGQTGNWGQGKWTGLKGEVCYSASQWLLHFWNLRFQSPSSPTPSLIVYLLALEMDCAFFKDALQASAGWARQNTSEGPDVVHGVPVCNLPSGQIAPFLFRVYAPPTPASVPLLKLFPWPGMPSAISGHPNPIHPSEFSSQATFPMKPLSPLPRTSGLMLRLFIFLLNHLSGLVLWSGNF